ncbi:MAG: MvaI/BcnI family restriction endonuclease [Verrucomicrobiota bacterium]
MKLYSKEELIEAIRQISLRVWHKSVKSTSTTRNDGAVGNTLETLLGIKENNLPIPNSNEWELKGQRADSSSLVTLKHIEPSPRASQIVSKILLPLYGWQHQQAGKKYPKSEMSFRSTTYATGFTNRGFRIIVDRLQGKLRFIFDAKATDTSDPIIRDWLKSVEQRIGLKNINPEPYWGLDDLRHEIGSKVKNCFYVVANRKIERRREYFKFDELYVMSGFNFDGFLKCLEDGSAYVDFDARTGHNHGTKLRIKQSAWIQLYNSVEKKLG